MMHGVYVVTGTRQYRGHSYGDTFVARLEERAEQRAIDRGDIKLLDRLVPALVPDSYRLPEGWIND